MKSLSAFNTTATDSPFAEPITLFKLEFPGSVTLYLCERPIGIAGADFEFDGQIYEPLVTSWDTIENGRIDPVTLELEPSSMQFVVNNDVPVGGGDRFTALFSSEVPQYSTVTVSRIFYGASAAGDKFDIFKGTIEDMIDMTTDRAVVVCAGIELDVANKFSHEVVEADTFTDADPDDVGKMLPQVYGSCKRVPFRAIGVGRLTTLSEDLTAAATTVKLTDSSGMSASGNILVDSEKIAYTGVSGDSLTGCTRGASGTTATTHAKGAAVGELKSEYVFALGEPVNAINDVYVAGVKQESSEYTAYTGQAGDEHATFGGRAIIAFSEWPQIKREVDLSGSVTGGDANLYRQANNVPIGYVKQVDRNGGIADYDTEINITFQDAPSGSLTDIYVEYTFEFRSFGTMTANDNYDFSLDGVLVAEIRNGVFQQFSTSPIRVSKVAWPTSAVKTRTYRGDGYAGVAFTVLSAKVYATSTVGDLGQRGQQDTLDSSNAPAGKFTSRTAVDTAATVTFPAAITGNLADIDINISWDFGQWGERLGYGHQRHYAIGGLNVLATLDDESQVALLPASLTLPRKLDISDLVAYWPMDESTGRTIEDIEGGFDGTFVAAMDDDNWVAGKRGSAIEFDGANDYIQCGDHSELEFTSGNFSVSFWALFDSLGGIEDLLSNMTINVAGWRVTKDANDAIVMCFSQAAANQKTLSSTGIIANTGQWYHVAITKSGTDVLIYVDSVDVTDTAPAMTSPAATANQFTIGASAVGNRWTNGKVDEVRIYEKTLSTTEVAQLYAMNKWQTSISKDISTLDSFRRGEAFIVSTATQSAFTDDYEGGVTITGNSMADSLIGGQVAADVDGFQDDGSGTYTGTPNALIERPDHILKHILIDRCGLAAGDIDSASYTAAGVFYAANSFTLGVCILQRPNARNLVNRIARQAKSIEFYEAGVHHLIHIPAAPATDRTVVADRIDLNQIYVRWTDRAAILNKLSARYARDWSGYSDNVEADQAIVLATDAGSVADFGTLEGEPVSLAYITGETMAQAILDWLKDDLIYPRLVVEFVGGYWFEDTERGDVLEFSFAADSALDKALLQLVASESDQFRVIDQTRRPDGAIQIEAIRI